MPVSRVKFTHEQIQKKHEILADAKKMGILENHQRNRYIWEQLGKPEGGILNDPRAYEFKFEQICIARDGTLVYPGCPQGWSGGGNLQGWLESCEKRGVIPYV